RNRHEALDAEVVPPLLGEGPSLFRAGREANALMASLRAHVLGRGVRPGRSDVAPRLRALATQPLSGPRRSVVSGPSAVVAGQRRTGAPAPSRAKLWANLVNVGPERKSEAPAHPWRCRRAGAAIAATRAGAGYRVGEDWSRASEGEGR